ncbi:POLDIP3 [Lepeophtheirus salmonis]|uniref:POLDIP3 n=1 Tax=Lepeophtheirus salmonis TaxID=72036 RepID=A0A7R8GZJ9_LEPSM|nr:POLDIP3 [Lepeophtheirus salmonis]CAF2753965.1 POLDIP3 [Lepeophtheirus salmonis]
MNSKSIPKPFKVKKREREKKKGRKNLPWALCSTTKETIRERIHHSIEFLLSVETYHNRQLDGKAMKCQLIGSKPNMDYATVVKDNYRRNVLQEVPQTRCRYRLKADEVHGFDHGVTLGNMDGDYIE